MSIMSFRDIWKFSKVGARGSNYVFLGFRCQAKGKNVYFSWELLQIRARAPFIYMHIVLYVA
jgi:hypothetical protein